MTESPIAVTCQPRTGRAFLPPGPGVAVVPTGDWPPAVVTCGLLAGGWTAWARLAALTRSPWATWRIRAEVVLAGGCSTPYPAVQATVAAATTASSGSARTGERRAAVRDSASPVRQLRRVTPNPACRMGVSTHFQEAAARPITIAASTGHSQAGTRL